MNGRPQRPPLTLRTIAIFEAAKGALAFAAGCGLWGGKHWAEWFAVISAGLYLPLELNHLVRHPTQLTVAVTLLNVAIIVYLARLLMQQRAERKLRLMQKPAPT